MLTPVPAKKLHAKADENNQSKFDVEIYHLVIIAVVHAKRKEHTYDGNQKHVLTYYYRKAKRNRSFQD